MFTGEALHNMLHTDCPWRVSKKMTACNTLHVSVHVMIWSWRIITFVAVMKQHSLPVTCSTVVNTQ